MRTLTLFMALLLATPAQYIAVPFNKGSGGACTTPPTTNMFFGYNADTSATCSSGGTANSTLTDLSGNGRTATISGTAQKCFTNRVGSTHSAIQLLGTGIYVASASACTTLPCTVYFTSSITATGIPNDFILGDSNTGSPTHSYVLQLSNNTYELDQYLTANLVSATSWSLPTGVFHGYAFTCTGSTTTTQTCNLYQDGTLIQAGTSTAANTSNGIDTIGGTGGAGVYQGFVGNLYAYQDNYSSATDSCVRGQKGLP